ncbi:MAG: hypothetical protein ACI9LX_001455 [Paraglaciecola sp.]|jgi:hypothetical protein
MLIVFPPARDSTMKTYKQLTYEQLTYEQRCQIYALGKTGISQNNRANQPLAGSFPVIQAIVAIVLNKLKHRQTHID